jgi:hypothetical protein
MGAGLTARQAIHKVTGVPLEQLGAVWLARLEVQTSGTIAPEHLESAVYGLGGLGLALAGWSRRRAFRRRMENWEEEDEALDGLTRELLAQRRSQAPASRLSLWR